MQWAAGEKRSWLRQRGIGFFPVVGWAERGGYGASGPGNSVPRFHVTWGTGPGVVAPFVAQARAAEASGQLTFAFRHRVSELVLTNGAVTGVRGEVLEGSAVPRGAPSSRVAVGEFELSAGAVVVTAGGIGGNHELARHHWPARLGTVPASLISGVPAHVDGRMLGIAEAAGGRLINQDCMWHYTEGIQNWDPIWPMHGIRILPGPSSLWFDAVGRRLPGPLYPGFDTLGTLAHIQTTGYGYTWFITTQKIVKKEFALSGSEQNPDLTGKSGWQTPGRVRGGTPPLRAFLEKGADFVVKNNLPDLVAGMNALIPEPLLDLASLQAEIENRDRQLLNPFGKDQQLTAVRGARKYLGDRLIRTAKPHRILDPAAGPLSAVRLHLITRKSLGGLLTDLHGRGLGAGGQPVPGLFAAGEVAGFGGGGLHGYRALEGTFLGGCLFSGRAAGRTAAGAS